MRTKKKEKKHFIIMVLIVFLFVLRIFVLYSINIGEKGVLSLTFDDAYVSQYEKAYPLMEKYGFNGTLYVIANMTLFEGRKLMSFEQAREMQESGWEIGSHTLMHQSLVGLSDEELRKEILVSKEILEKNGFDVSSIAFPYGENDEKVLRETEKYYKTARPLLWGYNNLNEIDNFMLKSKWVRKVNNPSEICSWVLEAKNKNLWLILDLHYIGEKERNFDISEKDLEKVLICAKNYNIKVKTIKEVVESEKRI